MTKHLEDQIYRIVEGKLSVEETKQIIHFISNISDGSLYEDEQFFHEIASGMSGAIKELALLIIDFRRDLRSKIDPGLTDMTTKHIPEASDQLEGIIDTTEKAANKIMDNLELLQEQTAKMESVIASLKSGKLKVPADEVNYTEVEIDQRTIETLDPLIKYAESSIKNYDTLTTDIFVHMSFQDLTGQRIKKIMTLVKQMEEKLKSMLVCFGIKLSAKEKNPDISGEELQKFVDEKVSELAGPQKEGQGMDQTDIDDILANI
ncbi:MAG: protein phosphatase CheZ [Desulfobacterium sp.]|nr:protein phosphatase CheZ [Desulfobacterium sp.]MBU3950064.1 protein phosphatase CheZ [Pseudomonadota bacterium]MBU4009736.1 protein phosphatase CheZ [Pseudomonadota bacterium]MBU4037882.1 protein phosphatase CheZ [Pseudomonadota bacterium]